MWVCVFNCLFFVYFFTPERMLSYSYIRQFQKCKRPDFEYPWAKLSSGICLQNFKEGGRVLVSGAWTISFGSYITTPKNNGPKGKPEPSGRNSKFNIISHQNGFVLGEK